VSDGRGCRKCGKIGNPKGFQVLRIETFIVGKTRMPQNTSTQKRIKRHVIGREHIFFATTPPGLESICAQEIAALPADIKDTEIVPGGVEFRCRLTGGYAANLHLRTPNRILMRLTDFKATNFRQLEKNVLQYPWELNLFPSSELIFSVKTRHSRLFHTTAITKRIETCIRQRIPRLLPGKPVLPDKKDRQHLFVRAVDDHLFLSLDCSGELLFKRGLKHDVGKAPLRETLAAAILKLAGYDGSQPLLDPMCGSGTFSLEAAMLARNIPPGFYRDFAFMQWPAFREPQWQHLKQKVTNDIRRLKKPLIFASDQDLKRTTELKKISDKFELLDVIQVSTHDFFQLTSQDVTETPGILVLNPPFGIRLNSNDKPKIFYRDILKKLEKDFRHWQIAILIKDRAVVKWFPNKFKQYPFFHGGIDLTLLIGVFN
jgi:putative N6-adenine-specific DNA methylase